MNPALRISRGNNIAGSSLRIIYPPKPIIYNFPGNIGNYVADITHNIATQHSHLADTGKAPTGSSDGHTTTIGILELNGMVNREREADYCNTEARIRYSIIMLAQRMKPSEQANFIQEVSTFLTLNDVNENTKLDEFNTRLDFIEALGYLKSHDPNAISEPSYFLRNYDEPGLSESLPGLFELVNQRNNLKEAIDYLHYNIANPEFKAVADNAAKDFEDTLSFRRRVVDFLRKLDHSPQRNANEGIFFINKLRELKNAKNPDESSVKGVERIFENAEEILSEGKEISGFVFEADLACRLIKAGFNVREVSVRENANGEKLISSDGLEREIDIIAEKEFNDCNLIFYIEAKTSISDLINADTKNGQLSALIELAERHSPSAQPVVILKSGTPIISPHGEFQYHKNGKFLPTEKQRIARCFLDHDQKVLIWQEPHSRINNDNQLDQLSTFFQEALKDEKQRGKHKLKFAV